MDKFNQFSPDSRNTSARGVLFGIICVTVFFFLLIRLPQLHLEERLRLNTDTLRGGELWRLISSLLVNSSGWNLFFEMFALYIFGAIIADRLNGTKMFSLYVFGGLAGNLLWLLLYSVNGASGFISGCGGAVYGVIMASAMTAPELQMYLLFIPFPIKLRTMAIVFMLLDVLMTVSWSNSFAVLDIGGFLGGYLFMRLFLAGEVRWDMLDFLTSGVRRGGKRSVPHESGVRPGDGPPSAERGIDHHEVDRILDKLSRTGINSLTEEEIGILEHVREQMNRKN